MEKVLAVTPWVSRFGMNSVNFAGARQLPRVCAVLAAIVTIACAHHPLPVQADQTQFLSDKRPEYAYLERIQQVAYEERGQNEPPKYTREDFRAALLQLPAADRRRLPTEAVEVSLRRPVPTRWTDPISFYILDVFVRPSLDTAAARLNLTPDHDVVVSTVPTAMLNAETIQVPGGDGHVIVVYDRLLRFTHELTKALVATVPINPGKDTVALDTTAEAFEERLAQHPEIELRFRQAINDFINIARAEEYVYDDIDASLLGIAHAMELFILGHEYGHAIRHHSAVSVTSLSVKDPAPSRPGLTIDKVQRSWRQELEADFLGYKLMHQALETETTDPFFQAYEGHAALLFFFAQDLLEKADALVRTGAPRPALTEADLAQLREILKSVAEAEATTPVPTTSARFTGHPPAWLWYRYVEQYAAELKDETADAKSADQLYHVLKRNGERLFARMQPQLLLLHQVLGANPTTKVGLH